MHLEIAAIMILLPTLIQKKHIHNGTLLHNIWIYTDITYGCKLKW